MRPLVIFGPLLRNPGDGLVVSPDASWRNWWNNVYDWML